MYLKNILLTTDDPTTLDDDAIYRAITWQGALTGPYLSAFRRMVYMELRREYLAACERERIGDDDANHRTY